MPFSFDQEVEEGLLVLRTQPMNIKALVRTVANDYIPIAKGKNVVLLLAMDPRIPDLVLGEKVRLRQALVILIENGIHFAVAKGKTCAITVEMKNIMKSNGSSVHVRIAVRDDGPGFDDAQVEIMFKPYSQLTPGEESRSVGMGLCIARQIVELHGGSLNVDTARGKGSTFYADICFALSPTNEDSGEFMTAEVLSSAEDPRSPTTASNQPNGTSLSANFGHVAITPTSYSVPALTINHSTGSENLATQPVAPASNESYDPINRKVALVVDDAASIRKLLKRSLERMGFVVDVCEDGDILVDKVVREHQTYDVIFLDNMMPRLRGVDAIRMLRAEHYQGVVIGVTGNVLKEDVSEFINAGCNDVLTKPVDASSIISALRTHGIEIQASEMSE
jgi:CheY-like chemotaxis protein